MNDELSGGFSRQQVPLTERAGFEVTLDTNHLTLQFGEGVSAPSPPETRSPRDLLPVLCDPDAARSEDILYTVYRGVAPREAEAEIARRGLVFVALVLRPGTVGAEFARTRGHTNNAAHATSAAYPEVHEIWQGQALLYLQRQAAPDPEDVCIVALGPGDKAVIAPGWASLIANVGTEPVVVGTWRTADCVPQHDALAALGGMAHFITSSAAGSYALEPNEKYAAVPAPRQCNPRDLIDFGLRQTQPLMTAYRRNPDYLRFMQRPQDYSRVWDDLYREEQA